MDPQLKRQLRTVLTYASTASISYTGDSVLSSTATCYCRLESHAREIPVGSDVIEERTQHLVILDELFPLTELQTRAAQFLLPSETEYRKPKVVMFCLGETGALDHIEVTL